jgi:ATP-binding cassette, subfamily F, member 3
LQSFEGGMLIVSHDRHLIKTVADSLWLVADGKLEVFDGDLDDYQQSSRSRGKTAPVNEKKDTSKRPARARAKSAPRSRQLGELRREIERVEKRIIAIEAERTLIELELCKDPMHKGLQAQHADLTREAASLETRWMEVGTAIEEAEALTAQCQNQRR